ncbi:MAG: helix-hairpin-helix domain-containing protein [Clostridia bacterium]|nr:helix-hairpin-helix domain-containing protein [Clostridia bacterium]
MNNKMKYIFVFVVFIILTILGYVLLPKEEVVVQNKVEEDDNYIFVHIEGQVKNPGLMKVKYGTRLYELIEKVGGETENADLTRVNLASVLSDEQKVIIPAKVIISEDSESREESGGLVNINTASKEKLMTLNGIGEGTAEKIVKYRQDNGYFNSVEDLKNVSGIGENKFNGLKDDITI